MRKLFAMLMFASGLLVSGQTRGTVSTDNVCKSVVLGHDIAYSIYLPPGYGADKIKYPVIYLLHGYSDNQTGWVQFGDVQRIATEAIGRGDIPPVIIVMPDAGVSWYVNDYNGRVRYEDAFFQDFIPFIEKNYPIIGTKEFRAISGLSMGGYGSLLYALKHPDMFTACVPMSAAVFTDEEFLSMPQDRLKMFSDLFGEIKAGQMPEHWKKNSVLNIIANYPESDKNKVRYYIDCGDDDFLYKGNDALHTILRDKGIFHEFRMRDGAHTWSYWRSSLKDALQFIGNAFHR
jgi:enterochelin esterase-like enzyme